MTLEEARRILAEQDYNDDPASAMEAVATWLRFEGIADPKLLPIADDLESVVKSIRDETPRRMG